MPFTPKCFDVKVSEFYRGKFFQQARSAVPSHYKLLGPGNITIVIAPHVVYGVDGEGIKLSPESLNLYFALFPIKGLKQEDGRWLIDCKIQCLPQKVTAGEITGTPETLPNAVVSASKQLYMRGKDFVDTQFNGNNAANIVTLLNNRDIGLYCS